MMMSDDLEIVRLRLFELCRPHKFELYDDEHDPAQVTVTVKRDDLRTILAALAARPSQ